jgi:hypothetical protein
MEILARDKHSSLLRKSVKYGRKKFYSKIRRYTWLEVTAKDKHSSLFSEFVSYEEIFIKKDLCIV